MNIRIGRISQRLTPGYGDCFRCHTTWAFVHPHITNVLDGGGMFPLCEKCWAGLTPEGRLPFYRRLFDDWMRHGSSPYSWEEIQDAVLMEELTSVTDGSVPAKENARA